MASPATRAAVPSLAPIRGRATVSSVYDLSSAAGTDLRAEASELLSALGAIRRVARRAVRNSAGAEPLPPARSELLRLIHRQPGMTVAEAAQELHLAPNSVSTMVSKLTTDGLLSRGRAGSDGRSVRLTVTDRGTARLEQWRDVRVDLTGRGLAMLSEPDRQAIRSALPALARLAEQMEAVPAAAIPAGSGRRA